MTARIAQLERQQSQLLHSQGRGGEAKRVDMLQIDDEQITRLLADAHPDTWPRYEHMMDEEKISFSEALARWLNDMNQPGAQVSEDQHPREAAERQRKFVKALRSRIISEQAPVVILGAGHSGGLAQVRYEQLDRPATAEDSPEFCEMFKFDESGNLMETKRVEI